jgi:hypothetical protein
MWFLVLGADEELRRYVLQERVSRGLPLSRSAFVVLSDGCVLEWRAAAEGVGDDDDSSRVSQLSE